MLKVGGDMAGGRPLKYKTCEEMQYVIDQYFIKCEGELLLDDENMPIADKYGNPIIINKKVPTITGLALALGFNGRKSLMEYQGRKEFVNTIMRAKSRCEEYAESRLYDRDGAKGAEFSLRCNFKWKDKPDNTESVNDNINNNIKDLSELLKNPVPDRRLPDE